MPLSNLKRQFGWPANVKSDCVHGLTLDSDMAHAIQVGNWEILELLLDIVTALQSSSCS